MRALPVIVSLLVAGCAKRAWVHPEHPAEQAKADEYDCLKENTFVVDTAAVDRGGARRRTGPQVDERLFRACMEARGYLRQRVAGSDASPVTRAPSHGRVVLEAEGRATVGFDVFGRLDFDAFNFDLEPSRLSSRLPHVGGSLGASVHTGPLVDLGLRFGAQGTTSEVFVYCDAGCVDVRQSAAAWLGSVDVRGRLPFLPRVWGRLGGGVQTMPAFTGATQRVPGRDDVVLGRTDGLILPILRLGAGIDLAYPDRHGLAWSFGADVLLRDPGLEAPEGGTLLSPWTGLTYRIGVGPRLAR